MVDRIAGVKGMNDLLPPDSTRWLWLEAKVAELMARWGYACIRTPIVESLDLFVRGLGEVTDIVEKEMYAFEDKLNGDRLTLRPEGTAGVVRAINEHHLLHEGGRRLYYTGPMFRHERPQKGRYRQFHQVGVEVLGFPGPDVDAETLLLARALWRELGLIEGQHLRLEINSLGQPSERLAHRQALIAYLEAHVELLDEDARRRLYTNPLRILDTKNPQLQSLVESAPQLMNFLGDTSLAHLAGVKAVLDAAGITYRINPRLVRGMDYYNLTVFEWVTDLLGAQGTVCGGGRYDGLVEEMGGPPTPSVGWAAGMERLALLMEDAGRTPAAARPVAVVPMGDAAEAPALAALQALRAAGTHAEMAYRGNLKRRLERANKQNARAALLVAEDGGLQWKDLDAGTQVAVSLAGLAGL
jgi:histidyl-tRNA synthetase